MTSDLFFTPSGVLASDSGRQTELLLELVCESEHPGTSPVRHFFREIFRNFLCRVLRCEPDFTAALPSPEELTALSESAPPVKGGCSPENLERLFRELLDEVMKHSPVRSFLAGIVPEWKDVGRVTFHLAENRRDTDGKHPFVFLATYPEGTGENGHVRHIPLASALKQYAADKTALCNLLQPVRTAAEKSPFLAAMFENKSIFKPCVWSPHDAFLFVREIPVFQSAGIPVRLNQGASKRPARLKMDITIESAPARKGIPITESILRFSAAVSLGGKTLSEEELAAILKTGGGLIRVRGEWVEADTIQIEKLLEQWRRADRLAESAGIPFLQGLRLVSGVRNSLPLPHNGASGNIPLPPAPEDLCDIHAGPVFAELLSGTQSLPVPQIPDTLPLRPYQVRGVQWLYRMGELGLGGCLADDMGLGKTLQILSFLELLRIRGDLARGAGALAIVPASLLENWRAEAGKFTPELRTVVLHSSEGNVNKFRSDPESFFRNADLTVTSYSMAVRLPELASVSFDALFLDEAQNIKNPACQQSGAIRKFRAKRKFALTGTPLENSVSDLWSIFDFLVPDLLGSFSAFRSWLHTMESDTKNGYAPLRKTVRPFILRRLKTDRSIIQDLPDKSEVKVRCVLTEVQAKMYARAVEMLRAELFSAEENRRSAVILGYLTQFKQICNHPTQFSGLGEYSVERSGKFQSLAALAENIALRGDKLLVFTQFREIIQPLHDMLAHVFHRTGLILHGGTSVPERANAVRAFQNEQGPPFFVLSLRAAGVGLNLTAANHVVHFDRWWNPAVENQATDRAYRIGQHRNVLVHKFVCRGTLEERIDAMIDGKRKLANSLLTGGAEKLLTEMSNNELLEFVRGGTP